MVGTLYVQRERDAAPPEVELGRLFEVRAAIQLGESSRGPCSRTLVAECSEKRRTPAVGGCARGRQSIDTDTICDSPRSAGGVLLNVARDKLGRRGLPLPSLPPSPSSLSSSPRRHNRITRRASNRAGAGAACRACFRSRSFP